MQPFISARRHHARWHSGLARKLGCLLGYEVQCRLSQVWAFGAMVYEMRVGRACFVAPDVESLKLRIKNGFKGGTETNPSDWNDAAASFIALPRSSLFVRGYIR